jgi:hypothetical protein
MGDEYKGNTYSCAHWPQQWGINSIDDWFKSPSEYKQHLEYLSLYLGGNYNTTANKQPNTCDFATFTVLECGLDRFQPWQKAPWAKVSCWLSHCNLLSELATSLSVESTLVVSLCLSRFLNRFCTNSPDPGLRLSSPLGLSKPLINILFPNKIPLAPLVTKLW